MFYFSEHHEPSEKDDVPFKKDKSNSKSSGANKDEKKEEKKKEEGKVKISGHHYIVVIPLFLLVSFRSLQIEYYSKK